MTTDVAPEGVPASATPVVELRSGVPDTVSAAVSSTLLSGAYNVANATHVTSDAGPRHAPALARLLAVRQVVAVLEANTAALVADARQEGASWSDVGDALGITRQSAHARYGHRG